MGHSVGDKGGSPGTSPLASGVLYAAPLCSLCRLCHLLYELLETDEWNSAAQTEKPHQGLEDASVIWSILRLAT